MYEMIAIFWWKQKLTSPDDKVRSVYEPIYMCLIDIKPMSKDVGSMLI